VAGYSVASPQTSFGVREYVTNLGGGVGVGWIMGDVQVANAVIWWMRRRPGDGVNGL